MNTNSSSFTREETNWLRVAAAFVTVHHRLQKRPRCHKDDTILPILPSRPTTMPSIEDHIHYIMMKMTQKEETVGSPRWKSLVQHLAQQLMRWDQTPQWLATINLTQQYAIWHELLRTHAPFFAPLLVPLLLPQRKNGYAWQLLQVALERAPLRTIEETVQELITAPPLNDLAAYYVGVSDGSELLSKWAQDNLLQQLLHRLQDAECAPKRGVRSGCPSNS